MEDTYKENLFNQKKKTLSSFYSITEKQEESSNSSKSESNLGKQLITDDNSKKHLNINDFPKIHNKIDSKTLINKKPILKRISSKSFNNKTNEKGKGKEKDKEGFNKIMRKESYKKIKNLKKRTSVEHNNNDIFLQQLRMRNNSIHTSKRRNLSSKELELSFNILNKFNTRNDRRSLIGDKNILNNYINSNKLTSLSNSNFLSIKGTFRKKSLNITNTDSLNQFYSIKQIKKSILNNKKIKINDVDDRILQMSLFEKLKNSPMFEKSEKMIYREKVIYGLLGLFTALSIIVQISDAFIYNYKSEEFLKKQSEVTDLTDIKVYYLMEKRKITTQENNLRLCNLIFSIICVLLILYLYIIKNKFIKLTNNNNNNIYDYYNIKYYNYKKKKKKYRRTRKESEHINIIPNNDDMIPKRKLPLSEIIKTILLCTVNLIFYPLSVNKVFAIVIKDTIHVYSLNSIILIFSFLKLINIYGAIIHLTPLNNLLYKNICKSKMVEMDFIFMFRYILNRYPLTFIIVHFFLIGIMFCIFIFCIEYFSLDNKKGVWNSKGNNNLKNIYNTIYLYIFYAIKNAYGDIQPISILGQIIMIVIGTVGLLVISYFFYYILELIKFTPEEGKAYFKLTKILNPINKEHKAANFIKYFLILKKDLKDYKNSENEYRDKKQNKIKKLLKKPRKHSLFDYEEIINSSRYLSVITDYNEYSEKDHFINYLCIKFISKVKIISECKGFNNNLIIARNFSHSFTDLLKNLSQKMKENLNQLNNKLQILYIKEKNYKKLLKGHKSTQKKIKKILDYQNFTINYLINKQNNENYLEFINMNRKGIRKEKNIKLSGSVLYYNKKLIKKKSLNKLEETPKKVRFHRVKSTILGTGVGLKFGNILKSKNNDKHNGSQKIIDKLSIKRANSLNNTQLLNNLNFTKKSNLYGFSLKKTIVRKNTYNNIKNKLIDNIKIKDNN